MHPRELWLWQPRDPFPTHPEQLPDEAFIGNHDHHSIGSIAQAYRGKVRIGKMAFRENGEPYPESMCPECQVHPVFVPRDLFVERMVRLVLGEKGTIDEH